MRSLHPVRISSQQRIHLAALLIAFVTLPLCAQGEITLDPSITQAEFEEFSRIAAQGIFATPVQPARAHGLLGFDIGVALTGVTIDTEAGYWQRAVGEDFSRGGYLVVPRLVASKGFSKGTISASYTKIPDTEITTWGGALDVPIIDGGLLRPTLALRGTYATLSGADSYDLKTYGVELFLSKGFGPVTPYAAVGRARTDARGEIPETAPTANTVLLDESDQNRITVGARLSLFIPKIAVEVTQGHVRSYAAKISLGL